jgi:SAM-dependent methyltransferase
VQSDAAAIGRRVNERYARPLFILTIVTGSFLLFLTQPMIARMALPRVGGSPSIWNSAMLVYQLLLLGGYAYAHWLARLKPRVQVGIHIILLGLAAFWLPIGLAAMSPSPDSEPALWVPVFLIASIGPLFFIVSSQAPLMQRWYALETSRGEPYTLYAASNLGSFAGLLSYPLIVEPTMGLEQQSWLWTFLYAFLVLLVAACALTVPGKAVEALPEEAGPAPTTRQMLHWVILAAIPSGLMLSTTTHLTTDIVAIPLLWVLPLGLYLLSFVIAFAARRGVADFLSVVAPLIILIGGGLAFANGMNNPLFSATAGLLLLFVIAVALHAEMFRLRPAVSYLTRFYLAMSIGGVIGGFFCAIMAPLLFDWAYEHPILIIAAAVLVPQYELVPWPAGLRRTFSWTIPAFAFILSFSAAAGILARLFGNPNVAMIVGSITVSLLALACLGRRWPFAFSLAALMLSYGGWGTLYHSYEGTRTRSYFGIYEVSDRLDDRGEVLARVLTHGTTLHGIQNMLPGLETMPTTYYARRSGVGLTMTNADALFGVHPRIAVVGLGSGTLSCYARPNQAWTFFEIDPAMVQVARNRFSFLSRCAPQVQMVLGDARLSLARQPANSIDILAVDAFSSDAVPMHLLTREALRVYGRAVQRNGIVLFHISNRYLDLQPVVADLAAREGWNAEILQYVPDEHEEVLNATISVWIALSRNPATLERLKALSGDDSVNWEPIQPRPGFAGWSDDHASILPIINFRSMLPRP